MYIHPDANVEIAIRDLYAIVARHENQHPNSLVLVSGDFNKANLKKYMPKFHQQVSCPTRGDRTLDHLYCPVKNAYKSIQRPHLGNSDHLMVLLIPKYKQKLKVSKPVSRTIH